MIDGEQSAWPVFPPGTLPPLADFEPERKSPQDALELRNWHKEQSVLYEASGKCYDIYTEMVTYCGSGNYS